jgi:GNAT superfamily N-acetyltransferase
VFCMATRADARRHGPATTRRRLGRQPRAQRLYLQVEETNLAARQLYTRLSFQPSHHYHYRAAAP